ncbi:MAG: hypothetical protein L0210_00810 [Rhodospirillales bacterium]|nr:hypothetical protein [Rhodospirillales bacterium]
MKIPIENRRRETAAKVAALTLANAFIFQEQLAAADGRVMTLRSMLSKPDTVGAADQHWEFICSTINYVPIFKIAREILRALPSGSASNDAVKRLVRQALSITARKAALRHDLMGRIYHWLLHDAKFLGTYYTSVPAATLLLKMVFAPHRWPGTDWSNLKRIREIRVADLACGTGTLLMAASQAITDNFIHASAEKGLPVDQAKLRDLHQSLMEDVIHGYDVLPSAIHLTASTLGLLAPEIAFRKMRLFSLPLGKMEHGQIFLGSIDYLGQSSVGTQLDLMGDGPAAGAAGEVTGKGLLASTAPLPKLSLCVMNPPFVRSVGGNLLFGSLPRDRAAMQKELRARLSPKRGGEVLANTTAGLGSVFTAVGDRHILPGGYLALVIPAAITTGVAWEKTRRLIDNAYDLEVVVSSHEADRWSFSENTDLSEVLLIARKRGTKPNGSEATTAFVNLWVNPDTSVEALATADAILRTDPAPVGSRKTPEGSVAPILIGRRKVGEVVSIPTDNLRGKPWLGSAFAQTDLVRMAWYLRSGGLVRPGSSTVYPVGVCRLEQIAVLGPDRRDIYDGFALSDTPTPFPAYWSHDADRVTTIAAEPNRWLSPLTNARKGRKLRSSSLLWGRAGRIMLAERMWLATQRLTAVMLADPGLSNVWWPTRLLFDDVRKEKALALWLNSTLGLLLLIAHRVPTRGPWVQFKKPVLEQLPVVDVRKLSEKALDSLAKAYDAIAEDALEPIAALERDPNRKAIDAALRHALSLPDLTPIAALLAREPIICNRPLTPSPVPETEAPSEQLAMF